MGSYRLQSGSHVLSMLSSRARDGEALPLYAASGATSGDIIARMRYVAALSGAVFDEIDFRRVSASDESSLGLTDIVGGGSDYSWASGLAIAGPTRLTFGSVFSSLARAKILSLTVAGVWRALTIDGAPAATSRPRWLVGVAGATKCFGCGVAYDGALWEGGNEYGALASPSLQSAVTLAGFAAGIDISTKMSISPRQADAQSSYSIEATADAATGDKAAWDAITADSTIIDYPLTGLYVSCWDSDGVAPVVPGGVLERVALMAFAQ